MSCAMAEEMIESYFLSVSLCFLSLNQLHNVTLIECSMIQSVVIIRCTAVDNEGTMRAFIYFGSLCISLSTFSAAKGESPDAVYV